VSGSTPERIEAALASAFPAVRFERQTGEAVREHILYVPADALVAVATFLRDDPGMDFGMLSWIAGVDYLPRNPRFEIVYHLLSITHTMRLTLKVRVPEEQPRVPSLVSVWPTADWHERETFDFYGIEFTGHPNLTRILLPDDWVGWPLRKDSPLGYEEVAFTHNSPRRVKPTPQLTKLKPKKVRYRAQ